MMKRLLSVCVILCLAAGTIRAQSDDPQVVGTARKTLQTYDKAIISLAAVLKFEAKGVEIPGLDQEHKTQCVAAIIDPSGLAVTSLTNLNPQNAMPKLRINRGGVPQTVELDCQVQEVKYRLTDGTEVPAQIVLKDEDLDLAFLAPLKPLNKATEAKMAVLSLGNAASQPELLDTTILIGRTNEDLNYLPMLNVGKIVSILSKPRTCYMNNSGGLGIPVFDRHGKVLGIICRCVKVESSEGNSLSRSTNLLNQLILPVADMARLVPQAKEEMKKLAENEKKADAVEKKTDDTVKKPAASEKKPVKEEKKAVESKKAEPTTVK